MMCTIRRATALCIIAMLLNTVLTACTTLYSAGTVSVLGPWSNEEGVNFRNVLDAFSRETGVQYTYQGTTALHEVLFSDVQKGHPPDIVILYSPGELAQYQHSGKLHKLDDVISPRQEEYSKQWLELQRLGTNYIYGVPVKVNLKSIIWFNPHISHPSIQTWDQLIAFGETIAKAGGTPWCMGMGAIPNSGWPSTDWIEDILLRQSGPEIFRQWASGILPWTSPQVRSAWENWGKIAATAGSRSALLTDFGDAGRPMFTNPPGCLMDHEPSYIIPLYEEYAGMPKPGTDFDFFDFPDFGVHSDGLAGGILEISADMASMFNDTPQARQLIKYLAANKAQEIWPRRGGGAFSANKNVKLDVYPDDVSKHIARELANASTLCFDAADLMPATMRNSFYRAALEYLSDPTQLDMILNKLDGIRQGIAREEWINIPCGQ
jgi:alpha-glucoside transport system substrate-binding protein